MYPDVLTEVLDLWVEDDKPYDQPCDQSADGYYLKVNMAALVHINCGKYNTSIVASMKNNQQCSFVFWYLFINQSSFIIIAYHNL